MIAKQYRLFEDCSLRELKGKFLVMVYPKGGQKPFALEVNESFAFLFQTAQRLEVFDVDALANAVVNEYKIDLNRAKEEVEHTLEIWLQYGLIK